MLVADAVSELEGAVERHRRAGEGAARLLGAGPRQLARDADIAEEPPGVEDVPVEAEVASAGPGRLVEVEAELRPRREEEAQHAVLRRRERDLEIAVVAR